MHLARECTPERADGGNPKLRSLLERKDVPRARLMRSTTISRFDLLLADCRAGSGADYDDRVGKLTSGGPPEGSSSARASKARISKATRVRRLSGSGLILGESSLAATTRTLDPRPLVHREKDTKHFIELG